MFSVKYGAYSLAVKLPPVEGTSRVRLPLGTPVDFGDFGDFNFDYLSKETSGFDDKNTISSCRKGGKVQPVSRCGTH